jgi:hypothetical protein
MLLVAKAFMETISNFREMFSAIWNGVRTDAALLPCPFCHGKCNPDGWRTHSGASGPACDKCGATTWSVETWNTRIVLTDEQLRSVQNRRGDVR